MFVHVCKQQRDNGEARTQRDGVIIKPRCMCKQHQHIIVHIKYSVFLSVLCCPWCGYVGVCSDCGELGVRQQVWFPW